jgi:dTDP-4-dehydrorhamnose 3,5-epimerase
MFDFGEIHDVVINSLKKYNDKRGWLIELFRHDEMEENFYPVMSYISQTKPGVVRGPHEHINQADYFCFIGPSNFKVYLWDSRKDSPSFNKKMTIIGGEENPISMIVPKGVVHAYKNIGNIDGIVFNAPNRLYAGRNKQEEIDEIRHEDITDKIYILD